MRHHRSSLILLGIPLSAITAAACTGAKPSNDSTRLSPPPQSSAVPAVVESPVVQVPSPQDSLILRAVTMEVHKDPNCGCCAKWVDYMKEFGFKVVVNDHPGFQASEARKSLGIPDSLGSCHTVKVGKYLVEGHVPLEDVMRMLREKPEIVGIAAPGMPRGSLGMEGPVTDPFDVVAWTAAGTSVFSQRGR